MKKLLKALAVSLAALAMLTSFVSCGGGAGDDSTDGIPGETITVPGGKIEWSAFEITEYTKLAKPGSKLHISVEKEGEYCKFQILTKDWADSGITEIYNEGYTTNIITFETETKDESGNTVPCHRPQVEDAGDYVIILNEASLAKDSLALMGNAKVNYLKIEYVGGKIEADPADQIPGYNTTTVMSTETDAPSSWGDIITIAHEKFTAEVVGMRITYKNATDASAIKLAVSDKWDDDIVKSVSGDATLASDNAINTFTASSGKLIVMLKDGKVEKLVGYGNATDGWGGCTFQGNGITITKVELLTPAAE